MQSQHVNEADQLKSNDLVWGQINNGVWWPGQLSYDMKNSKKRLYKIDFFGFPPIHAFLPLSKIIKYTNNQNIFQKGRMSPGLKRAISQAHILFKTLEESKNQLSNGKESKPIQEGNLPQEKTALLQLQQNERQMNLENKNETGVSNFPVKLVQIKDQNIKNKRIKKEKIVKIKKSEQDDVNKEEMIEQQKYLHINKERLLVKKLYKTLKKKLKKEKSRKIAIQLFQKRKNKEWRSLFEECKQHCKKGKKIQNILEKSRILRRISQ